MMKARTEVKQCPHTSRVFRIPRIEDLPLSVCTTIYVHCEKCDDYHKITELIGKEGE